MKKSVDRDTGVLLAKKLSELLPDPMRRLIAPRGQCAWSQTYVAEFTRRGVRYIKGTPRSRVEARVTAALHGYYPDHLPAVLADDLLPEHPWHWFLLENAGDCNHDSIPPECAVSAAYHLGKLQRSVCYDEKFTGYLPQCRADGLQEAVSRVCAWALQTAPADQRGNLLSFRVENEQSTSFYRALQKKLTQFPPTCVHGDFWSGNIACRDGKVSFIDWGDTLWGVGSISIVNLLDSASGELSSHEGEIWEAYSRGWDKQVTENYIQGSRIAALVGYLVIDVEIARCCNGTVEMLPGLFPAIQRLADLWG